MPSNRRQLLKLSVGALLTTLGYNQLTEFTSSKESKVDVIIIGAGIAGLAAATELQQQGYKTLILEARDRLGGRIWTNSSLDQIPLDLGASWIHGTKGNPLSDLVKKFNLKTLPTNYASLSLYDSKGKSISEVKYKTMESRFEQVMSAVEKLGESPLNISLQAAIDKVTAKLQLSPSALTELNYFINSQIEHEFAADAASLPLQTWDEGKSQRGNDVVFPKGYSQIITNLGANLRIETNQIVSEIKYGATGVEVKTNQGVFLSDRLIITLPLGVLKSEAVKFMPPLPPQKLRAIKNLGVGVLNKLCLQFPEKFWDDEELLGYISAIKGEWAEFLNIDHYTKQPILMGFNAGSYGTQLEMRSDQEIVNSALVVLRKIYGNFPNPKGFLATRWRSDPFAKGSYSFNSPNAGDRQALAKPMSDRLFWAGEATSTDYPATVHGALISGRQAAKLITKL